MYARVIRNTNMHQANDLHFDWDKPADYVQLKVDHINNNIAVPWAEYKTWDLGTALLLYTTTNLIYSCINTKLP